MDSEAKKWVISGIGFKLPIFNQKENDDDADEEELCTTPTSAESRICTTFSCPPPPPKKKRKSSSSTRILSQFNRQFFHPPDLETVFIRRRIHKP
ncbi:hypothetical protein M9H77_36652 [Catharanthus roseus]|uniref:Uncharacterized protein n=1 Tax=Catharanthus roseus TaxID=4058 RepID=A0ACB9ZSE7_CATRO|nr:hypothetical protein M9H77_36652 [Catharanthus roseus]